MKTAAEFELIAERAAESFWGVVARELPECKSGDFGPDEQRAFDEACLRAVTGWYRNNVGVKRDLEEHGFVRRENGGGFQAYFKQSKADDGDGSDFPLSYVVITDTDSPSLTFADPRVIITLYDDRTGNPIMEGAEVEIESARALADALLGYGLRMEG